MRQTQISQFTRLKFSLYMMTVVIETYVHLGLDFPTILKVASCTFCQVYYPFAHTVETVQDFESFAVWNAFKFVGI